MTTTAFTHESQRWRNGLVMGCLGVVGFSGALPATRLGVPAFLAIALFAIQQGGGRIVPADGWLLAATLSVGLAYVEGGRMARDLGGTATLCRAMIFLAPFAAVPLFLNVEAGTWLTAPWQAWTGFWYAAAVSMFFASVAWYRGLAAGGAARIGQLNLPSRCSHCCGRPPCSAELDHPASGIRGGD